VTAARAATALGAIAILAGLAIVLSRPASTYLTVNRQAVQLQAGVVMPPRTQACQDGEPVPAGGARVQMLLSTGGKRGGPLTVTIAPPGGRTVSATSRAGYVDQPLSVPIGPFRSAVRNARFCVRNPGPVQVAVLGVGVPPSRAARVNGKAQPIASMMRLRWDRASAGTRFDRLADIARRASLAKASWFGSWLLWAALALTVVASALGVRAALRAAAAREGGG
jgi:hypothetical protein